MFGKCYKTFGHFVSQLLSREDNRPLVWSESEDKITFKSRIRFAEFA